jgi:outer membrane protein assembly factor BamB
MTIRVRSLAPVFVALLACGTASSSAQQISYFRSDRGLADETTSSLPTKLDDAHLVWKEPLPSGHSSPILAGKRLLLTGHDGNQLSTLCLDSSSGRILWRQSIEVDEIEKVHTEGSAAAASVATDGRRIIAFFGSFGLLCYDIDGKPLWSKKLGPFRDEFGSASSPVLFGGQVFLNEDHDLDSHLLAVRETDGETLWQTPREGFTRSYATPVIWSVAGKSQLVVAGALELVAYDPANGRPLWRLEGFARIVNTTPVVSGDMLYVCTWSPGGDSDARIAMESWPAALTQWDANHNGKLESGELPAGEVRSRFFRIDLDSDQALSEIEWSKYARLFELAQNTLVAIAPDEQGGTPRIVWQYKRGLPYVASPLVYRGKVYLAKDGGIVTVLDATTGKLLKQVRMPGAGNYYASPVAAAGKVVVASGPGVLTILDADNSGEVLESHDFGERIAATPAIAAGRLYVRTDRALYCFEN